MTIELTGNVPVAIFQSVEIQHELPDGDLEDFKQTHVLKERVRHLWRHKKKSLQVPKYCAFTFATETLSMPFAGQECILARKAFASDTNRKPLEEQR